MLWWEFSSAEEVLLSLRFNLNIISSLKHSPALIIISFSCSHVWYLPHPKGFPSGKESAAMHETQVLSLVGKIPWRREWPPIPVFLPGKSCGQKSLAGYSSRRCKESDMTERLKHVEGTHNSSAYSLVRQILVSTTQEQKQGLPFSFFPST